MPDAITKLNDELRKDFPGGRLTHEPLGQPEPDEAPTVPRKRDIDRLAEIAEEMDDCRGTMRSLAREAEVLTRRIGGAL